MKAYSQDLRERVLRAVDKGKPRAQIIELFRVSRATIKRYLKQRRETGHVQPQAIPGRTPRKGAALQAHVGELLHERSDARLEDYCQMWESRFGVMLSPSTMSRASRRAGYTRKKTLAANEQKQQERAAWRAQASQLDARQLVFIDECGSNIALTQRYGRAPKGQRVNGSVPRNRGKNTTLIASLCWDGESMILKGAANAAAFEQYVESILAPHLSAGQIVVMDKLPLP
jgi:transposase